jgi:hypothetical protein
VAGEETEAEIVAAEEAVAEGEGVIRSVLMT